MDVLSSNAFTTSRGLEYFYWSSPASPEGINLPALLFLHGFRDTSSSWRYMLPHLSTQLPHRLLFPDLLGHGDTAKPTEPRKYAYHLMVKDILEMMDSEGIAKVVVIGHDHGSGLAQRFYNHAPTRTAAVVLLNIAYSPPSKDPFNLVAINALSRKLFGYAMFEYWNFLTAPDAASVMKHSLDRVWESAHSNSYDLMRHIYGEPGAMREYLVNEQTPRIDTKPYASDETLKLEWKAQFKRNGFEAPLCWYIAYVQQVQFESDGMVPTENAIIRVPLLFIGCEADAACRAEMIALPRDAGLTPDLTIHVMKDVGHWPMYEQPKDTADLVVSWIRERVHPRFSKVDGP